MKCLGFLGRQIKSMLNQLLCLCGAAMAQERGGVEF